jgi:hypothetical protein
MRRFHFSRRVVAGLAGALLASLLAAPARASGPYTVDDAAITPAGDAQIETWVSLTGRGHVAIFAPATTFTAIPFAEWSLILDEGRQGGSGTRGLTAQVKLLKGEAPAAAGEIGFSASGALRVGLDGEGVSGFAVNTITTLAASDGVLLHGNLGLARDAIGDTTALTWGARAEWAAIPDRLALHGEVFGTSETAPGFQLGLRPTILGGAMDLEFIVSRNLSGEKATWATLGLAVRF